MNIYLNYINMIIILLFNAYLPQICTFYLIDIYCSNVIIHSINVYFTYRLYLYTIIPNFFYYTLVDRVCFFGNHYS